MNRALLLIAALLLAPAAHAADEAKIAELLRITDMEKTYGGMMKQSEGYFAQMQQQVSADPGLSPKQKEAAARALKAYLDKTQAEFSWEKMKPFLVSLYTEVFTDQEIDDMIAFYKTPTGQAVMAKTPLVFEKSMQHFQARMNGLLAELQKTLRDELAKTAPARTPTKVQ